MSMNHQAVDFELDRLHKLCTAKDAEIAELRSEIERMKARNAELEALAAKWATDAPLSERRTLHEASVAYRKAAGTFPNPDGVKAILDK